MIPNEDSSVQDVALLCSKFNCRSLLFCSSKFDLRGFPCNLKINKIFTFWGKRIINWPIYNAIKSEGIISKKSDVRYDSDE
jgi:hypothetical protein